MGELYMIIVFVSLQAQSFIVLETLVFNSPVIPSPHYNEKRLVKLISFKLLLTSFKPIHLNYPCAHTIGQLRKPKYH